MIDQKDELFTPEQNAILDRVDARLAAGVSLLRLHLETGVRHDYLQSVIQRDSLPGRVFSRDKDKDVGGIIATLSEWLSNTPAAHEDEATRAETPSFNAITNILAIAHQTRALVGITGPVGFGKSFAALCYAADHPRTHKRPGAVRIQFNKTDNKPAAALAALLDGLHGGGGAISYRNGEMYRAVGAKLRPGDFLILDECQRLGDAVDIVASLHDDFSIGIAMIGNPDFSKVIWGKDRTFDALGSRILRHEFTNTTGEDVEAWLSWKGCLEGLPIRERASLVKAAVSIGTRPGREGGLRTLNQVIDYAARAYNNQPMSGPLLSLLVKQFKEGA